jgi:hypothetical protein
VTAADTGGNVLRFPAYSVMPLVSSLLTGRYEKYSGPFITHEGKVVKPW